MNHLLPLARASLLLTFAAAAACADNVSPVECGFNPLHINDAVQGTVLQLQSDEACVKLTRRDLSEAGIIYKAYPWALEEMVVAHVEQTDGPRTLSDEDDLTWTSTHHNWNDEAVGEDGALRYRVALPYGPNDDDTYGYTFELHVEDQDGAVVAGPFDLDG